MFSQLTTVADLLSDGHTFGQTDTHDVPFTTPTDESDWNAWLTTGELEGYTEVDNRTNAYPSTEGLTMSELNALDRRGLDMSEAAAQCEESDRNVTHVMRALTLALESQCWRQVNHIASQCGQESGKGVVGRTFHYLRGHRHTLRDFAARLRHERRLYETDVDVRLEEGFSHHVTNSAATTYMTSDLPTEEPVYEDGLLCEDPSEEWGQCVYHTDKDRVGRLGRDTAYMYHLRHFSGIREGRYEAILHWMGRCNKVRARTLLSDTGSKVVTEMHKTYTMTRVEEREWCKRYTFMQEAWGRGVMPDYREATCLTFKQVNALKSRAWDILRHKPSKSQVSVMVRRARKAAPAVGKTTTSNTFDDLVFWGE